VTGGAAVLVDPLDVAGWAEAMADLLGDTARRTVLARRGVERAHHFRWPTAAAALAGVYRDAVLPPPSRLTGESG
jgi:glycosyltransferase involved in cell wall biosynthesis